MLIDWCSKVYVFCFFLEQLSLYGGLMQYYSKCLYHYKEVDPFPNKPGFYVSAVQVF